MLAFDSCASSRVNQQMVEMSQPPRQSHPQISNWPNLVAVAGAKIKPHSFKAQCPSPEIEPQKAPLSLV